MDEKFIADSLTEHRNRNLQLQAEFEKRQIDLNEHRPIDFHFWASTQRDAAVLARSLYQKGFLIRLISHTKNEDDDSERWSVEAGAKIPLAQALGDELSEELVRMAAHEDSIFDGWGTSI
jgi:hypothetical protein